MSRRREHETDEQRERREQARRDADERAQQIRDESSAFTDKIRVAYDEILARRTP